MIPQFAAINAIEAAPHTNLLRVWCRSDMTPVAPLPGLIGQARRRPLMAPRDPNKLLARHLVNAEVRGGHRPHPNTLACVDCGHVWFEGERRHEYDHHNGYEPEHHFDVEPVCTVCHAARDGAKANQTACIHGHVFTPENTIIHPNGTRHCRECRRRRDRGRRDAAFWREWRAKRTALREQRG